MPYFSKEEVIFMFFFRHLPTKKQTYWLADGSKISRGNISENVTPDYHHWDETSYS